MRRITLLLAVMTMAIVLGSGIALAANIACGGTDCRGTDNPDTIRGSVARNVIYAFRGNDLVYGNGGNDEAYGNVGNDVVRGGPANDEVYGGSGDDQVYGDGGTDGVYGGSGADAVIGGPGVDEIYGGSENDRLNSEDGVAEIIDCGLGFDTANVDVGVDNVSNCERVF